MKNIGVRSFIVGLCLMGLGSWSPSLKAQIADRVYKTDYHIDPEKARELSVELDNISFFKDNEYTGKFTKGYSLPGLWVQGKAVYYPLRNIKLEAGVHMLLYFPGGCASRGVYRRDLFTAKVQRPGFPFPFLYAGARIGAA